MALACVKDEARLRADDRADLARIVEVDLAVSRAMKEADDASRRGDVPLAKAAVKDRALPNVQSGLALATGIAPRTEWGRERKAELVRVLEDRAREMPSYEQALASGDLAKTLAAVEAQAAIERRALAAVAAAREGR